MRALTRSLLVVLYPLAIGLCVAAAGVMLGVAMCETAFDARMIVPNAAIDDDAAMLMMGFAMGGGAVGLVLGTLLGWRVIRFSVFSREPHVPSPVRTPSMRIQ